MDKKSNLQRLIDDFSTGRVTRREFVVRGVAAGLSVGAVGSLLAGCGKDDSGGSTTTAGGTTTSGGVATMGGAIKIGQSTAVASLDPAFALGPADLSVASCVFEGLVAFKPGTYELENVLAEEFTPSEDGLSIHFKLKPGIPFHGGYGDVTADDVKYTFERVAGLTDPPVESPYVGDWSPYLKEVRVAGPLEGDIILSSPFSPLFRTTLPLLSGLVLCKKAVEERGEEFATKPIGTGPYEVVEFTPDQQVVIKPFEDYGGAGAPAQFEEIAFIATTDAAAVQASLTSGDLDIAMVEPGQVERLKTTEDLVVDQLPSLGFVWIAVNLTDPSLEDARVRQALRLAVDVPAVLSAAYEGVAEQATSVVAPVTGIGVWEDAPKHERDVEAAKALLKEAGKEGLALELTTLSSGIYPTIAQLVQANLAEAGVEVKINPQDEATFWSADAAELKRRQLTLVEFGGLPDPYFQMQWFTSDQIGVYNMQNWSSADFDRLHLEAAQASGNEARTAKYVEMAQLMDESAAMIWLVWLPRLWAHRSSLNPIFTPYGEVVVRGFVPA